MDAAFVIALHQWASQAGLAGMVVFVAQNEIFVLPVAMVVLWVRANAGVPTA